ncbi:MAG: hypothetical protein KGJ89_02520 [Patescibacteria group bacterium]|nr:hypothetical protein [Patescibacteria group bacterium]MDE2015753.1 hypothetical protein [Patescibacteria group bacterium]MDE2226810.1 hypothetical protein [Patescibacteria group bacterium]
MAENPYIWYEDLLFLAAKIEKLMLIIMAGNSNSGTRAVYREYKKQLKLHWICASNEELMAAIERGHKDFPADREFYKLENLQRARAYHQQHLPKSMIQ